MQSHDVLNINIMTIKCSNMAYLEFIMGNSDTNNKTKRNTFMLVYALSQIYWPTSCLAIGKFLRQLSKINWHA